MLLGSMNIYCMYNSCVADRLEAEGGRDLLHGRCVATPICCFAKMTQVRTMHEKPGCVQT